MIKDFVLNIEIDAIKDFLTQVLQSVGAEISGVEKKAQNGGYENFFSYESDLSTPIERQIITIKAVYYELNALVEWKIKNIALSIKPVSETLTPEDFDAKIHNLFDFQFNEAYKLLTNSQFKLNDLPNYQEMCDMREKVNAFTHRSGFRGFKKTETVDTQRLLEHFSPNMDETYCLIEQPRVFLSALDERAHLLEKRAWKEPNGVSSPLEGED